jgi:hypothetical protein
MPSSAVSPSPRSASGRFALLAATLTLAATLPAGLQAQTPQPRPAGEWCDDGGGNRDRERVCEVREERIAAGSRLEVDGAANGGIRVLGWDGSDVLVRSRVAAQARRMDEARALLEEIEVRTGGNRIRAEGPRTGRQEGWSVSYEIFVPRSMDLELETTNGGILVADVSGDIRFDATNGGVTLDRLGGDVRGRTTNGGLQVSLAGDRWQGDGMDVETTNGGVTVEVPEGYSAVLEAGTTNGGMEVDFPVTIQGRVGRRLNATLGEGGPPIRITTTNGRVRLVRP